jgi:hypothetical protein
VETALLKRTVYAGKLGDEDMDREVCVAGWVDVRRDLGGMVFIELRDPTGKVQLVSDPNRNKEVHEKLSGLRTEYVIVARGKVSKRPAGSENRDTPTGLIEIYPNAVQVLNTARPLPFQLSEGSKVDESLRLKNRYLDLRRPEMNRNLVLRHRITTAIRQHLNECGFIEVETPILTKATPEGARDFLVPSRMNPGEWYALPQSPQLFKQTLMISGIDRYYQIARCFRDEDLRADRQPEFTQVDIELSFPDEEDVMSVTEGMLSASFACVDLYAIKFWMASVFGKTDYWQGLEPFGWWFKPFTILITPFFCWTQASEKKLIRTMTGAWIHLYWGPVFFLASLMFMVAGADFMGLPGSSFMNTVLTFGGRTGKAAIVYTPPFGYKFPILKKARKVVFKFLTQDIYEDKSQSLNSWERGGGSVESYTKSNWGDDEKDDED